MRHFFPEPADEAERALLERAAQWAPGDGREAHGPEQWRALAAREGCDFATAALHRCIVESEVHGPFLRSISGGRPGPVAAGARVVVVPGAFYRENPRTGADGRLPREVAAGLGLPVDVVPVSGTGWLADNARALSEWLLSQKGTPVILVSVSKGGSDIKAALARPDAEQAFANVIGWINLCGILDGTPMADWLLSASILARANRFVYRIRGRSLDFLTDLRFRAGGALDGPLLLPAHMRAVHVVGFPMRRHLRGGLARRCHSRIATHGPNDGVILLGRMLSWPGQLCPIWGADHYLRPRADMRPLVGALMAELAKA